MAQSGVSEDFYITIEVKRTADGTFIRAFLDGHEAQDDETQRALVEKVAAVIMFYGTPAFADAVKQMMGPR